MMTTIQIQGNISFEQIQMAIRVLKAMGLRAKVDNKAPNKTTLEAMKEAEKLLKDKSSIGYDNMNKLVEDLYSQPMKKEKEYILKFTSHFKKDFKRYRNNKVKSDKIIKVLELLKKGGVNNIPDKMKPHFLIGNYAGHLECHIEPNLLLIWLQYDEEENQIVLVRLGSHSELFGK